MGDQAGQDETPAQKKQRAEHLRSCAARARKVAGTLGPYLDATVKQATASPPIWTGPYAIETAQMLTGQQGALGTIAPRGPDAELDSPPVPATVTVTESPYRRYFRNVSCTRTRS